MSLAALLLGACSAAGLPHIAGARIATASLAGRPAGLAGTGPRIVATPQTAVAGTLDGLIARYAAMNGVPAALVHRIVQRESGYNPRARNGPYWGLMQIRHDTARSMGYSGPASGLLDAETNLRYGVKYLAGAYLVANKNSDQAVRNYARGYYYDARRMGLLEEVGLR